MDWTRSVGLYRERTGPEWLAEPIDAATDLAFLAAAARPAALAPFALAAATFAASITLRSLDMALRDAWPAGTHFAWHCLNAVVLASLGAGLARLGGRVSLPHRPGRDPGAA